MSLQKKCLTASAVVHGLLLMLVVVGSAFIPQKPTINGPEFEIVNIPDVLVEDPNVLSGNSAAGRPQETPQTKPQAPVSQPPPVTPAPPIVKPEPLKSETSKVMPQPPVEQPKTPKPDPEENPFDFKTAKTFKNPPKPEKTESPFKLNEATKQTIKTAPRQTSESDSARATTERANQATKLAQALEGTKKALQGTGSRVGLNYSDIIGPGDRAQMSYDLAIAKIYEDEFKKRSNFPNRGNEPPVEVEVTVRRDGTVMGDRIAKKSGRSQFDRAVQDVLNTVKKNKVIPFPADFKSETRTIKINFNLEDSLNNG